MSGVQIRAREGRTRPMFGPHSSGLRSRFPDPLVRPRDLSPRDGPPLAPSRCHCTTHPDQGREWMARPIAGKMRSKCISAAACRANVAKPPQSNSGIAVGVRCSQCPCHSAAVPCIGGEGAPPWKDCEERNSQLRTEKDHLAKHFQEPHRRWDRVGRPCAPSCEASGRAPANSKQQIVCFGVVVASGGFPRWCLGHAQVLVASGSARGPPALGRACAVGVESQGRVRSAQPVSRQLLAV